MARSGVYTFNMTAGEVVLAAARKLGIVAEGAGLSDAGMTTGLQDLNLMLKSFPLKGIDLWRYEEMVVFLNTTSSKYLIGASGDRASFNSHKTEIATAAIAGASTITVDSDDDIANGDVIGIELDSGTIQWTTVNGVPAANVVTLTATLTGAVAVDNHVYNYTTIAQRPERVYNGRVINASDSEVTIESMSLSDYQDNAVKATTSFPTGYCYVPTIDNGTLYVSGITNSVKNRLAFSVQRQLQDITSIADNIDIPQTHLKAVIFNLAVDMAFDYNIIDVNSAHYQEIKATAKQLLDEAEDFDIENTSVKFEP
jgi:hypothetical protein